MVPRISQMVTLCRCADPFSRLTLNFEFAVIIITRYNTIRLTLCVYAPLSVCVFCCVLLCSVLFA